MDWLRKIPKGAQWFIGILTAVVSFIFLIRENYYLGITVILIFTIICLAGWFSFVIWSREKSKTGGIVPKSRKPKHLFTNVARNWAKLGIIILVGIIIWIALLPQSGKTIQFAFVGTPTPSLQEIAGCPQVDGKMLILLAKITGPDPEKYRVNELILSGLEQTLLGTEDYVMFSLDEIITEELGGTKRVYEIAEACDADIILWGWYAVTESDALVNLHINGFYPVETYSCTVVDILETQQEKSQLNDFSMQFQLREELSRKVLFISGFIKYLMDEYHLAIYFLDRALSEASIDERPLIYKYRAYAHIKLGLAENAIEDLTKALEIFSSDKDLIVFRSLGYSDLEEYEKALLDIESAIKIDPDDPHSYYLRGNFLMALGDEESALESYSHAIEKGEATACVYNNRGLMFSDLGDYENAEKDFTQAISIEPDFPFPYFNRGVDFKEIGKFENAISDISKAIDLDPNSIGRYFELANVYLEMGDLVIAKQTLDKARELDPDNPSVYLGQGHYFFTQGEYQLAIDNFEIASSLDPTDYLAVHNQAISYYYWRKYDLAIERFDIAIKLNPTFHESYYMRGMSYWNVGNLEQALIDLKISLTLSVTEFEKEEIEKTINRIEELLDNK